MTRADPRESLAEILRIEPQGEGRFTARLEDFWGASATADLWARATLAACHTLPGDALHSLHAFPLAPAPCGQPLSFRSETLDARGGLTRVEIRVEGASPHARVIASLGPAGDGPAYADAPFRPARPKP